jgi:hypothetical protein
MMRKFSKLLGSFLLVSISLVAQEKISFTDLVTIDFNQLAKSKARIQKNDREYTEAFDQLKIDAEKALKFKPVSVMNKTDLPPSGDKHDYMSIAPYWWPNPNTANGIPYVRRDGEINPEVKNFPDKVVLPGLSASIYHLSLAYYFTGKEAYATHASKLVRVWFLDTATRMNPNLKYAQSVKGVTDGRAEGVIDTRHFMHIMDAIQLLKASPVWTDKDQSGMEGWVKEFIHWLGSSKIGIEEMNAPNNHGVWYDAQLLAYAGFMRDTTLVKTIYNRVLSRLDMEMDAQGSFPLEMRRTTSLHYSVFILNAYSSLATRFQQLGLDLWKANTASGKSLKKGFDFILPYLLKKQAWAGPQINEFKQAEAIPLLNKATTQYGCAGCSDEMKRLAGASYPSLLMKLL